MQVIPLPAIGSPQDTSRIFDVSINPLVRLRTIEAGEFEGLLVIWLTVSIIKM